MKTLWKFITKYKAEILVVLLTLPAIFPLARSGFFTMHDDQQVVRLFELDRSLAAGQFPARWVANLGFGYGYPLFIFYPPFVYYLGEIFHLALATSFIDSVKLVFAFAFLGSALTMYLWTKDHFGKTAAVLAAAFYTYAPYHAVNAYVRGALAELTTFVWLPLGLWSIDRLMDDRKRSKGHWLWLAVSLSLLMLTHNLIFLPFLPLLLLYTGFSLLKTKNKLYALRPLLYAVFLAFGLSAFFWVPALVEKKHTLVDSILLAELAQYKQHFVYPSQLWNSLWGYGGSTAGPLDGMTLKIGKLHVALALFAPLIWLITSAYTKTKRDRKATLHASTLLFLGAASAFMTTQYSQIIWSSIRPLQYLQFPWRFLTFTILFASPLAASSVRAFTNVIGGKIKFYGISLILLVLLLYPNLKMFQPQAYLPVSDSDYTNDEFIKWRISKTSFEFLPKGVKTKKEISEIEKEAITQVDISRYQIATSPYRILSGSPSIGIKRNVPGELVLSVSNPPGIVLTILQLSLVDFPGWEVRINGRKVTHSSDNDLKLITLSLPPGEQRVEARFRNTPVRSLANLASLTSSVIAVFVWTRSRKQIRKQA